MRVDIFSPVGGLRGGIENVINCWVKNLNRDEFDVRVIHATEGIAYLEGYEKAYEYRTKPEVLNDLSYYVNVYLDFISKNGAPDICVATNWPMMCVVASLARDKAIELGLCEAKGFKVASWIHNKLESYKDAGLGGISHMLYADLHLAINNQIKNQILAQDETASVYVVGNPAQLDEGDSQWNEDELEPVLAYVGRLEEVKRVDIILEALYRARNKWKLIIVGVGDKLEELKECVSYLKLEEYVTFKGWQKNPWESCREAVCVVFASEYEGFPLTGIEALYRGKTLISTPVNGVVDYVRPGENGYFYDFEDAKGLAEILDAIYEDELPLCDPQVCKESVMKYSVKEYINTIENVLRE